MLGFDRNLFSKLFTQRCWCNIFFIVNSELHYTYFGVSCL